MLTAVSAIALPYAACVVFYHAHPEHSALRAVRRHAAAPGLLRAGGVALLALALAVVTAAQGWELGIPIFLGILSGAGILTVLGATFTPRFQLAAGTALALVGSLSGMLALA